MSSQEQPAGNLDGSSRSEKQVPDDLPISSTDGSTSRREEDDEILTKSKRNACELCRRRKLRCDGGTPCGACTRLSCDCTYAEQRRKSGPKRGYVRELEAELAQLKNLLKQNESSNIATLPTPDASSNNFQSQDSGFNVNYGLGSFSTNIYPSNGSYFSTGSLVATSDIIQSHPTSHSLQGDIYDATSGDGFRWATIELGLDEPLPPQSTIDALTNIYFAKVHPACPVIHQYRFLATINLSPGIRPSVALRYAMWALAASSSEEYKSAHPYFYLRARKYAEADESAERHKYLNIRHAQAWLLIALYEFKMMHFPLATLTTCRAIRLTQIMGLHRLDGLGLDVKRSLPPPMDWIDKEERRRTFWMAFVLDRYASVGTGWPMVLDERDIVTNLPSSEEAYALNEETPSVSLSDGMLPENASSLSSLAGVIIVAYIRGRTLVHLQRSSHDEDDGNLNGEFWRTHRKMDNILLNTSLCLPSHLRMPAGSSNANVIFLNTSLQTATICLHQAAIFKAEKFGLLTNIIGESRVRCITAATEIASIMKMIAHKDLSVLHVFTPFHLYVAIRTFSQVLKCQPEDDSARSSLQFLLSALIAIKPTCPIAEIYLVQLDLEGIGLSALQNNVRFSSGLEKRMAEVSIRDNTDDFSWVTFVSPLVRIVEEKDESIALLGATASNPDEAAAPWVLSMEHISGTVNPANLSSASRDYGGLQSTDLFPEQQSYAPQVLQAMDDLTMTHVEFDQMNMPNEMFDSLAAMRPNNWDGC